MQDAPRVSVLAFIRPLIISVSICLISLSVTIFSMAAHLISIGGLQKWTEETWSEVHAEMSQIFVVPASSSLILKSVEVEWWMIPAYTLVFVAMTALALVSGIHADRLKSCGVLPQWFRNSFRWSSSGDAFAQTKGLSGQTLCSSPSSPTSMYEMKSAGWDDTLRPAAPAKVKLSPLVIPAAPSESTIAVSDQDDPFVQSTLNYIESPTGRSALGLPPIPPALYHPTGQRNRSVSPPTTPPRAPSPPKADSNSRPEVSAQAQATQQRPNSIISGPWPRPPSTIPASPRTPSPKTPITVSPPSPVPASLPSPQRPPSVSSFTSSIVPSTIAMDPYAHDEPIVAPFQDSAAFDSTSPGLGLAVPKHIRKVRSRDVLLPRSLSVSSRGRRNGSDGGLSGGIYMTVVRETD
ncbi:hypothetical protein C8Q70DRAFT_1012898 [Cubamyces menziesii]|nr:hypothetical protein C8Q70DRAFT_1012898 [Cubamyces menziesii]